MIRLDFRLGEVVRREVCLKEKYRDLEDQLSPEIETGNKRQLIRVYAELQTLYREYWAVVRKIYRNELDIPGTRNGQQKELCFPAQTISVVSIESAVQ